MSTFKFFHKSRLARVLVLSNSVALTSCAWPPTRPELSQGTESAAAGALREWSSRELPGKSATQYSLIERAGRPCVLAQANKSASLWRRGMKLAPDQLAGLQFDWWIGSFADTASVTSAQTDDAPARLLLGFDGDVERLSMRNRMQFDLVQTLTGEAPPYALLMYVWDASAPVDTLVVSTRSDRIRKIVVGSGPRSAEHKGWVRLQRDVAADFARAFGEAPGPLISMALMTDGDNTRSRSDACYGNIMLFDPQGQVLPGSLQM
ncbi:DUF3047 domain-containing protein [Paucibacter sp. KCTC 42545]|uniref:DUF3047 domain-containing protein n=1 Tax=Paucibacter sp. KCTC 42545 TaxID=1768242 RepID=UPI0009E8D736|nr:DUF3047 domain-containing protein [Paucibacter sp. KCTC 42545]